MAAKHGTLEQLNEVPLDPETREAALALLEKRSKRVSSGCREMDAEDYGQVQLQNVRHFAHRLAFVLNHRPLEPRECVLHSCDNPRCIEPKHLSGGTKKANSVDASNKGRLSSHVLTAWERACIVSQYRSGWVTYRELGKRYGVTDGAVRHLVTRYRDKPLAEVVELVNAKRS